MHGPGAGETPQRALRQVRRTGHGKRSRSLCPEVNLSCSWGDNLPGGSPCWRCDLGWTGRGLHLLFQPHCSLVPSLGPERRLCRQDDAAPAQPAPPVRGPGSTRHRLSCVVLRTGRPPPSVLWQMSLGLALAEGSLEQAWAALFRAPLPGLETCLLGVSG